MSANWNLPVLSSLYTDVLSMLRERDIDALTMQITPGSSVPNGAFRFNRVNNYFEEWDGDEYIPKVISIEGGGTGASSIAGVIDSLNLGTMSTQNSDNVTITGGNITGITNFEAVNVIASGSFVAPANSILEPMIADGSLLARVAGNETITGNWTTTGIWTNSGPWSFSGSASFTNNFTINSAQDVTIQGSAGTTVFNKPGGVIVIGPGGISTRIFFTDQTAGFDIDKWFIQGSLGKFGLYEMNSGETLVEPIFSISRTAFYSVESFVFGNLVPNIIVPTGTAAIPGISGIIDPLSGIYFSGASNVTISIGGGIKKYSFGQIGLTVDGTFIITTGGSGIICTGPSYSQLQIHSGSGHPGIVFNNATEVADMKKWRIIHYETQLQIDTVNDTETTRTSGPFRFERDGGFTTFILRATHAAISANLSCGGITNSTGLASGQYTPGFSLVYNVSSVTVYPAQYLRVGNVVTVSGKIDAAPAAVGGTIVDLSIPIPSNAVWAGEHFLAGTFASGAEELGVINAYGGSARLTWTAKAAYNHGIFYHYTYLVT